MNTYENDKFGVSPAVVVLIILMINHTMRGFLLPPADTGFHLELTSQKPQRIVIREKLWGSVFFRHYRMLRYIPCVKVAIMRRIPVLRHVVTLPRHRLKENTFRFGFAL